MIDLNLYNIEHHLYVNSSNESIIPIASIEFRV